VLAFRGIEQISPRRSRPAADILLKNGSRYRRLLSDCRESHRNLLLSGEAGSSRLLNRAGLAREQKEVNQIHRHLISKATRGALRRPGPRIAVEAHVGGVCGFVTRSAPSVRSCR
jgi:hypothetical protein